MAQWQLQTAKQRFSEVIRAVENGDPQFITKNGKEVAVIINMDDYRATHAGSVKPLVDVLFAAPQLFDATDFTEVFDNPQQTNAHRERDLDEVFAGH